MKGMLRAILCAVAVLAAMSAISAEATTYEVTAKFDSVINRRAVHLVKPGPNLYVYAGQYWFEKLGVSPDVAANPAYWLDDEFGGYCIDVNQTISWNHTDTWQIEPLANAPIGQAMGAERAELLQRLWGKHFVSGPYAEFQVAVWELLVEDPANGYNVTTGDFYAPYGNEVNRTTINDWLLEITDAAYDGPVSNLMYAMTSSSTQDFAVLIETGGQMVPEPVTLAGLALGSAGLIGYLRKRKGSAA